MIQKLIKKIIPHLIAVALFAVIGIVYFAPETFDNKNLPGGDIKAVGGWGKDLADYHQQTGEYAFWSNRMFSGMPANYTFMPPLENIFGRIGSIPGHVIPGSACLIFLYLIGFYIFMLSLGCKPWLGIVGAIAYTLASYNFIIIEAGHYNKALVMSTMAPVIGGIILCYRKKYLWGAIVTLLSTGIDIVWGHQQISYYLLLMILTLAIVYLVYAIKEHKLGDYFKSSAILLVVAALSLTPESGKLLTTSDYTKETMRGGAVLQNKTDGEKSSSGLEIDYAYMWSYGKGETMTLLIPNFYGASSHYNIGKESNTYKILPKGQADQFCRYAPMYWGSDQLKSFTSGPVYVGAIICFLFLLGLQIVKGREKWWLLTATIISIVLAWGRHFPVVNNFLFYHLPLYNKFRTPEMALVIAEVAMAALAILSLKTFEETDKRKLLKSMYIAGGITGGLCLLYALFGDSMMSFSGATDEAYRKYPDLLAAIVDDRRHMLTSDAWRSLFFIAAAFVTLWYYLRKPFNFTYATAILGVLIFIDMWTVDKRFINYDSFVPRKEAFKFTPTPANELILQDKDPNYRVMNLTGSTFNESETSYFHKSIGGYSPAKLRRYQDIIDYHLSKNLNMNVLNMLNTRYFIVRGENGPQVAPNRDALGNAWFVDTLKWVDSPDEEIVALNDLNPARTVVIDREWQNALKGWEALQQSGNDSTATIRLSDYANPGYLIYESSSATPRLAVFSEVYYKTWHAYIDGQEAPLVRVNYILRGLEVPAGNHKIEFKCIDDVYLRASKMSKAGSIVTGIVIMCLFGFAIYRGIKRSN